MTAERARGSELDDAAAAIYGGPPDEFVSRRDALSKELRAAGRRDDATAVKRLRKPKRLAWALDAAVLNDVETVEHVDAAVKDTLAVQSAGGDPREAFGQLRLAVQELAAAAVQAAAAQGHAVEHADLVQAVLAVIGASEAFDALRTGRLVDVPAAGGLDFLTLAASPGPPRTHAEPTGIAKPYTAAARGAARRAESVLAAARDRAAKAERALRVAEAKVEAAEDQLQRAQQELDARRAELEQSQREADAAATQLSDAEQDAAHTRDQVERLQ